MMNEKILRHVIEVNDYLTEEEHQIAKLYLKGKSSKKEISEILSIPRKEVRKFYNTLTERVNSVHKCDHCSSTMRAFCKTQTHPEHCHGPHNW